MTQKILIMGLPGAGKTTLARELETKLCEHNKTVTWLNGDKVREQFDDWDFSHAGRIRQSKRMRQLADTSRDDFVICDFVAPLIEMRDNFAADLTVWVDTIDSSRYADTNSMFQIPEFYDFRILEQNAAKWANVLCEHIVRCQRSQGAST